MLLRMAKLNGLEIEQMIGGKVHSLNNQGEKE